MSDGDAPIYEEAVDEYLALVNGPLRVIGDGLISPPVREDPADLLAVVRRGVESGTIEGEVVWPDSVDEQGFLQITIDGPRQFLVIPLEDGDT